MPYAVSHYAECHYAECHYAGCRGALTLAVDYFTMVEMASIGKHTNLLGRAVTYDQGTLIVGEGSVQLTSFN